MPNNPSTEANGVNFKIVKFPIIEQSVGNYIHIMYKEYMK